MVPVTAQAVAPEADERNGSSFGDPFLPRPKSRATVKTALRPDFFEWFPFFGSGEMKNRAAILDVADATLLHPKNLVTYAAVAGTAGRAEFSARSKFDKALGLKRVLIRVGINPQIAATVASPFDWPSLPTSTKMMPISMSRSRLLATPTSHPPLSWP